MSKFIKCLVIVCVMPFITISCKQKEIKNYNFENVLQTDYQNMVDLYQQDSFLFYESMITYKFNLDTCIECNPITKIVNVFQKDGCIHMYYHFTDTNVFKEIQDMCDMMLCDYTCKIDINKSDYQATLKINDLWLGDIKINIDSINIPLDSAYNILLTVNKKTPNSNMVTLRQPITAPPFMTHPIYIFGNMMDNVIIDGMSGKVVE